MNSIRSIFALMLVLMTFAAVTTSSLGVGSESRYVEGELLVKFRGGPDGEAATRAQSALQHAVKRRFRFVGWQHITLPRGTSVEEALPRYARHPGVLAVEPNVVHENVAAAVPNDPRYPQQYALDRMAASTAWNLSTGNSN